MTASSSAPSWDVDALTWSVPHIDRPNSGWPSPRSSVRFLVEVPNNGSPVPVMFGVRPDGSNTVFAMSTTAVTPANARDGYIYFQTATGHSLGPSNSRVSLVALGSASGGHTLFNGLIPQRSVGEALFEVNPFVSGNAGRFIALDSQGGHFVPVNAPSGGGGGSPATYVDGLSLSGNQLTVSREGTSNPSDQTITLPEISTQDNINLTQVGSSFPASTTSAAANSNIAMADLPDVMLFVVTYTDSRANVAQTFSGIVFKSQITTSTATTLHMQVQGLGASYILFIEQSNNLFSRYVNAGGGSYSNVTIRIYNILSAGRNGTDGAAGATGPQGPAGPQGALAGGGVTSIVGVANQAAYDALTNRGSTTLYIWTA